MNITCKHCNYPVAETFYFCPNCGKKIKDPPPITTLSKQISLYLISVLLPPLGLWPGFRYLFSKDPKAKVIGTIAIVLTIVSLVVSIWATANYLTSQLDSLNSLNNLNY
jgi:hypothetical protein